MKKNRRKFTQCPNCGYTFEEANNYCPNCGQENHDLNVPVKHLIWEFLEGTLHYDTKFWLTLKYLLFRPGLLTVKFNNGQRASYVPPFRLYVFVSLVFFTVLALRSKAGVEVVDSDNPAEVMQQISPDDTTVGSLMSDSLIAVAPTSADAPPFLSNEFGNKFISFVKDGEHSKQKLLKNTSFMMFLLMPFFGFILYLIYYRQGRNYVEHLMFSIHFHTFFFILVIVGLGIEYIYSGFDVDAWAFLLGSFYLYMALHRVYKLSYWRTLLRWLPITLIYLVSLAIFVLGTLAVSVMLG